MPHPRCETCQFAPCRCEDLAAGHMAAGQSPEGWPMASEALGVHPGQIPAAMEQARRLGVPTDFDRTGRAVLTGPGHRKALMKALGYEDRGRKVITQAKGSRGLAQRI